MNLAVKRTIWSRSCLLPIWRFYVNYSIPCFFATTNALIFYRLRHSILLGVSTPLKCSRRFQRMNHRIGRRPIQGQWIHARIQSQISQQRRQIPNRQCESFPNRRTFLCRLSGKTFHPRIFSPIRVRVQSESI